MPDEPAVLEVETPTEPEAPAVAEPEVAVSPEGDTAPPAPEIDHKALLSQLKGLSADEVRVVLEELPEAERTTLTSEWERRGEQRAQTRAREMSEAQDSRHQLWQQASQTGKQAENYLSQQIAAAKQGNLDAFADPATIEQAAVHFRNGAIAQISLDNEQALGPLRDQFLPDATPDEKKALEQMLYEDARKGTLSQLPKLFELATARAKAEGLAEGLKQVEKKLAASETLARKLAGIEAIKNGTAPVISGGAPAAGLTAESYAAMTPGEQRALQKSDPAAIDRMTREQVTVPQRN